MLEEKPEGDKGSKPGLTSPQSSILDFFISPNKGQLGKKTTEKIKDRGLGVPQIEENQEQSVKLLKAEERENFCSSQDESSNSVILLSEDTSQDSDEGRVTGLRVSGASNREKCIDRDPVIERKDDTDHHQTTAQSYLNMSTNSKQQTTLNSTESGKGTDVESLQDEMFMSKTEKAVTKRTDVCTENENEPKIDSMKNDQPAKKKRKRKSSECAERKKTKTDPNLQEVSMDQNCSATEMSYEAFIQSLSTPGRDTTVDSTSPDKDSVEWEDLQKLDVKNTMLCSGDVPAEKKPFTSKKKSKTARTSLFSEENKQSAVTNVEEQNVSSRDNGEKGKKPSILNFFSKVSSSGNSDKEHQVVTVLADIHHHPDNETLAPQTSPHTESSTSLKPQGPRVISPKSPGVVEIEEDIEIIGSETVIDSPQKKKTSKSKKKTIDKSVNKKSAYLCGDNDLSKDDVKIERIEEAPRTAEVDAFLKGSDSPAVPVKSAQATLSFTKTGLKATAAAITPHNTRVRSETDGKSASKETNEETQKGMSKKKKKIGKGKKTVNKNKQGKENNEVVVSESDKESPPQERRARRVRYQVSSLQFDDSRQTPIKMKIRLKKSSSGEESDFTPRSSKMKGQKQQKAQKLLEKAKKVKKSKTSKTVSQKKKKHDTSKVEDSSVTDLDSSTDGGGRRRSARLKVQSPSVPILVDDDEEEIKKKPPVKPKKGTKTPLKLKAKDSPAKTKVKNSPLKLSKDSPRKQKIKNSPLKLAKDSPKKQKGGGKLAPIFGGKSKMEPEKPKEPEDPEKVRLRQAFLMSDVPEMLKRKVVATATVQNEWGSVGFPTISHIQQKPGSEEEHIVWNLPSVKLPFREWDLYQSFPVQWKDMSGHTVTSLSKTDLFKDFSNHPEMSIQVVDELLGELEAGSKGLSVRQLYSDMQQKLRDDLRSQNDSVEMTDKSVLAATDTEPLLEDTDKKKKGKGAAGRGGRGKKKLSLNKDVEEVKVIETSSPTLEVKKVGEMMWSERYQPAHSTEVIGHQAHIQKLKSWLLEWKHRTHKEARKMRLQMLKQSRPKSAVKDAHADSAWWGEEDSDFDLDSEESDDEDDSLCNTMLITGPHGVGKTTTVYALAQELGYKVIEVNAASSRNGKKILSKLQEATQSHQVAASKDGGSSNMLSNMSSSMSSSGIAFGSPKPAKKESKLPTAFTNLFRKAARNKTEPVEIIDLDAEEMKEKKGGLPTKSKRKRKREKEDEKVEKSPKKAKKEKSKPLPLPVKDDSSQSGALELSSTTLILFDEVEIFFEDDRGYLPAIQHFMTRTKIPIILTTTDSNFGSQLQARFESLIFKQPSLITIASHLQTICLVEHVRTCPEEMLSLVKLHRGDIRKCLLWLQFWLTSGGGATRLNRDVKPAIRPLMLSTDENTCSQDSLTDSQEIPHKAADDDDDFVVTKPSVSRRRRVLDDDESSSSNVFPTELVSSQLDGTKCNHLPQVHCLKLEAMAGISRPVQEVLEKVLQSYLKGECDQLKCQEFQELCHNLQSIGLFIISQNLLHLLPLPKMSLNAVMSRTGKQESKQKHSRIRTDLFDDEASNDSDQKEETLEQKPELDVKSNDSKTVNALDYNCLKAFSHYYDSRCCMDVLESSAEQCLSSKCYSGPEASSDSKVGSSVTEDAGSCDRSLVEESRVMVEMRSARQLYSSLEEAVDSYWSVSGQRDLPENVSLPVYGGKTKFSLLSSEPRLPGTVRKAHENISDCLPLTNYCSHRLVHMDYLPSLRAISRAEQHRQAAKTKRRFHHYFDNIGLSLKESSLNVLCQTFN